MNKQIRAELGNFWREILKDETLIKDIKKAGATSFFIQLAGVIEKGINEKIENNLVIDSGKNSEFLLSARDMLNVYTDIIKPASKKFALTINKKQQKILKAMDTGNLEKVNELTAQLTDYMMDPFFQSANIYADNDKTSAKELAKMEKRDIESLKITGSPETLFAILDNSPQIQKMRNAMEVEAIKAYMDIDKNFTNRPQESKDKILEYVKDHPKAVMALYFATKANKAANKPETKIFAPEDLRAKCEMPAIQDLAENILLTDREASFKKTAKIAQPVKGLNIQRSITREVDDNKVLIESNSRSA